MVPSDSPADLGTIELVQRAASDAKELVRLEIALAKNELSQEVVALRSGAILGAVALTCSIAGLASCLTALGLVVGPLAALAVGILLLICAGLVGFMGYRRLPKRALAATEIRMRDDEAVLKEHMS